MEKDYILREIKRTAEANSGVPLGKGRFYAETGIKETDWRGKHWVRWSDALKEAGLLPNRLQAAFDDEHLLRKLADLVRELGHFPVFAEMKMKTRTGDGFPSLETFRRFGAKAKLAERLLTYCREAGGWDDVIESCRPIISTVEDDEPAKSKPGGAEAFGDVYLLKSGKYYKVGFSNAAGRRERELAIQLPEKATRVHTIKTDDPVGIEAYWHKRFADRHKNGEWFELSAQDVAAFRRRKFM